MALIYLLKSDGTKAPYPEERIDELRNNGSLYSFTYFWKEGMSEWKPVKELTGGVRAFIRDPARLTSFLIIMLWCSLGLSVLTIGAETMNLASMRGDFSASIAETIDGFTGLGSFIALFITGVAFLKWIYRAGVNARGFGATGMKISAGWAVGYYFIPILNLFRPYRAMEEIWKASKDPGRWQEQLTEPILPLWWGLWIANNFLSSMYLRAQLRSTTDSSIATIAPVLSILGEIVSIALCIVAIKLVTRLIAMQKNWVEGRTAN